MYKITGHCTILDEFDNIVLDKSNDIHPGNFARAISRSLANESNYWVNSIAFGLGATVRNFDKTYLHYSPNDGIAPDYAGWKSSLYNEVYRKTLDPISLGNNTTIEDLVTPPTSPSTAIPTYTETHRNVNGVVSYVSNNTTYVEINCILGEDEGHKSKVFTFDEIALYTGQLYSNVSSYHDVIFTGNTPTSNIITSGSIVNLTVKIDGSAVALSFAPNGTSLSSIITALNKKLKQYYCYAEILVDRIRFHSTYSVIEVVPMNTDFLHNLNVTYGQLSVSDNPITLEQSIEQGTFKNNPNNPQFEEPRLLTHLIFDPLDKPRLSVWKINYKLAISVEPTPKKDNNLDFVLPNDYRLPNTFEYNAVLPSDTWVIYHQLGYTPKIEVFDDTNVLLEFKDYFITYGDAGTENAADNQVTIRFNLPHTGTARFY